MSIADILVSKHLTSEGYNTISDSYKNVKAIQVIGKNFSKFLSLADTGELHRETPVNYSKFLKIAIAVTSKPIYCFFKSYLHLLQLF